MAQTPTCGHPDRPVFSKGNCNQCARVVSIKKSQRKPRATRKKLPRVRVRRETELTAILRKIYRILCAELKTLHLICEGKGKIEGCTGKATEIHHRKGRRRYLLILSKYFGYLCHNCHVYCTKHSKEAKGLGLSLPINSKTEWHFTAREIELMERHGLKMPNDC